MEWIGLFSVSMLFVLIYSLLGKLVIGPCIRVACVAHVYSSFTQWHPFASDFKSAADDIF